MVEVHHQEPRYPGEDAVLIVMVQSRPVEWYFRVSDGVAVGVCKIKFTGDTEDNPVTSIHPNDEIPQDVVTEVLEYEGEYSVGSVMNPVTEIPENK